MKTVLVMSTALDKSMQHTKWQQPLGISYIAACVRDISEVTIIDCEIDKNYVRTLIKEIDTEDQLVVGISSNTYSYHVALNLAKTVREHNPRAHINLGGYHSTPIADLVLKNRAYVDSVIRGDGEVPFRQLLLALSKGDDLLNVGSLTYRKNGKIISNPYAPLSDLDSLPYPARDLLPMDIYFNNLKNSEFSKIYNGSRMVYINGTRGCTNHCNYCCLFNRTLRARESEKIVDEFEYVINKYNSDIIYFVGDNLNWDRKWLLAISDNINKRDLNIKWIGVTVNPQNIDEELINAMEKSGCINIFCGFESASPKILRSMNRSYSINNYKNAAKILRRSEIITCASFILGHQGETKYTLNETIDFVEDSNFDRIFASIISPLPGTLAYKQIIDTMPGLKNNDDINIEYIKRKYVEKYCAVNYNDLENVREKLADMSSMNYNIY